jgi:SRSO17 transposase
MTTSAEIADWRGGLDALHGRIAHHFRRAEARERAKRYLAGLLDRVERKNGWQLAEHLGEAGPQGVQRLLNAADWDVDAVRDDLRSYVTEHVGEPAGVLIVDETGFLKKGTKSVGVQRQYSGTAGRIENCQIGVFVGYASATGRAFLDRELYLPQEWAQDPARRDEAGVPPEVTFATKPALAQQMLARAFAAGVPAAWVSGDAIYGDDGPFRHWLAEGEHPYVLAVAGNHPLWRAGKQERADRLIAALPAEAWAPLSAGTGSQGERLDDWASIQLSYESAPGTAHWLLARRSLSDPREVASYRVFGPADTPVATMVRVAGMRWAIEASFEDAKGAVGLDHYEVRKWTAWYRHVTLALLAHAYLEVTRLHANEGKKGALRTSSPSPCRKSAACC